MTEPQQDEIRVDFKCKFCGRDDVTAASKEVGEEWFNALYPLLACNRCADYRSRVRRLTEAVVSAAVDLIRGRQFARSSEKAKKLLDAEIEPACRESLMSLTKTLARVHCRFENLIENWEPSFAENILRRPEKAEAMIEFYIKNTHA